jgi:hypothetical protein
MCHLTPWTIDVTMKKKKKTIELGYHTSWYHCVAEDSRIPKMPVINPLPALVHPPTQKNNYPA